MCVCFICRLFILKLTNGNYKLIKICYFNREEVFHMVRTVPERDSNGSRDTTRDNVKTRTLSKTKDWVT